VVSYWAAVIVILILRSSNELVNELLWVMVVERRTNTASIVFDTGKVCDTSLYASDGHQDFSSLTILWIADSIIRSLKYRAETICTQARCGMDSEAESTRVAVLPCDRV